MLAFFKWSRNAKDKSLVFLNETQAFKVKLRSKIVMTL